MMGLTKRITGWSSQHIFKLFPITARQPRVVEQWSRQVHISPPIYRYADYILVNVDMVDSQSQHSQHPSQDSQHSQRSRIDAWTTREEDYLIKYIGYSIEGNEIAELLYIGGFFERKRTINAVEKRARRLRRLHNLMQPNDVLHFLKEHMTEAEWSFLEIADALLTAILAASNTQNQAVGTQGNTWNSQKEIHKYEGAEH